MSNNKIHSKRQKTRTCIVKRNITNRVALFLELFRRARGDFCNLQRKSKQKESIDNRIYPTNNVDEQEILFRLKKRTKII